MRICFYNVTASFIPGGLETYCWELGRALASRGHQVTIIAGNRGGARYPEVELLSFPFRIETSWPNLGTRFRRLMERLSFARHSLGALVRGGYDAVIVNKPFDFPILARARQSGLRAKTLFRSGGTDFFLGDRLFANAIQHWVSSSRYNARQIEGRYHRHVEVIHNGVDVERFVHVPRAAGKRDALGLPADAFVIASVGRLVGWKGLRTVIEALGGLPERIHYLVVGEGPDREGLEAQAAQRGLQARVHFAGRIAHDELPGILSQCDALVQPSIGEEAFGISVVEAMACGLPALVSDQGGLPEIVVDGECGRLLAPGDVEAWRKAIAAFAGDAPLAARLGAAARERIAREFTWKANAAKHEALLFGER
ncbi:MAG: glycosyltransferase family 4 protein [Betaproteobacteria bacterium]|nr:glycosyltransferase family 4 protein [Betaproteobacteria bacterium]